jgi:hypothetical protein
VAEGFEVRWGRRWRRRGQVVDAVGGGTVGDEAVGGNDPAGRDAIPFDRFHGNAVNRDQ